MKKRNGENIDETLKINLLCGITDVKITVLPLSMCHNKRKTCRF